MGYYLRQDRNGKFYGFDSLSDVLVASGSQEFVMRRLKELGYNRWDIKIQLGL